MFIDDHYASDQCAQTYVYIIRNVFCIILAVTGLDRGSISNVPQRQSTFFCSKNVLSSFCTSMKIKLQIKILKPMCLSSKISLGSFSKLQVASLFSLMINMFSKKMIKLVCVSSNISLPSLLKWADRKTHDKITKYRGGYGESTAMVTVKKIHLNFQNNLVPVHKGFFFLKMNLKYEWIA